MIGLFALVPLVIDPWSLVRVEDPDYPGAEARGQTGAVLLEPPPAGVAWEEEDVPLIDTVPAEEAIEALATAPWVASGATGEGVKVAVFDLQWFSGLDLSDELGPFETHDCVATTDCSQPIDFLRPRFGFEQGVHGIACAEVVHDIAPEAELHLVRVQGRTTLENAVEWAIREDIDLISMSLSFLNSSFHDGRGPVSALAQRLAANDILMVTSSGNYARGHWGGPWTDGDRDGRLDFDGTNRIRVRLEPGSRAVLVQWDQRLSCGQTDLDLRLVDEQGRLLGSSTERQVAGADRCQPFERVASNVDEAQWAYLEVLLERGSTVDLDIDIMASGARLDPTMPEGSIADPAASPFAFTVGAVDARGYLTNDVESFSSQGSRTVGVPKPDVVGPDGVSTAAYGARGFFGTSASTPAVTGALAVLMSDDPSLGPFDAAAVMRHMAVSDRTVFDEHDPALGWGKARLLRVQDEGVGCGTSGGSAWMLWLPGLLLSVRRRASG